MWPWSGPWANKNNKINTCIFTYLALYCLLPIKAMYISIKVADLNFGCATFCALPLFGAVTTFSSRTALPSHKVSVKCSDIDMCSAIYFLFDHYTKYCTIYNLFMSTHCSCHC